MMRRGTASPDAEVESCACGIQAIHLIVAGSLTTAC